jgi:hypothetical protein
VRAFTHKKRGDAVCTGVCTHLRCRLVKAFNGTVAFSLLPCRPLPANTTLPANRPEPLLATRLYGDEWREDDELKKKKVMLSFLPPRSPTALHAMRGTPSDPLETLLSLPASPRGLDFREHTSFSFSHSFFSHCLCVPDFSSSVDCWG